MRYFFRGHACRFLFTLFLATALPSATMAADASWNSLNSGSWTNNTGIWTPSEPPGSTTTDNTDTATFSYTLTGNRTITVDTNRYIGGISFGNTVNFGFTLQTGTLHLNSGGVIQTMDTGVRTDTISATNIISGASASTYTLTAGGSGVLAISGPITGSATSGNTTTLTLNGASGVGNAITGIIGNGSGGGTLAIVKDGAGAWSLGAANTFSGSLTVKSGTLTSTLAGAFGNGPICLGDTSGNNNATLVSIVNNAAYTNNITIQNGSSLNILTIEAQGNLNGPNFSGTVALNNNLTADNLVSGKTTTFSGTLTQGGTDPITVTKGTGAGNVTIQTSGIVVASAGLTLVNNSSGTGLLTLNTCPISGTGSLVLKNNTSTASGISETGGVNNNGSILNCGTGTGSVSITGIIGTLVAGVYQNSSTSMLVMGTDDNKLNTAALHIQQGTVQLVNGQNGSAGGGLVTIGSPGNSCTLDIYSGAHAINSIATDGTATDQTIVNSSVTAGVLTISGATSSTFGGAIRDGAGTVGITLNAGTLTLSGSNTYTGPTTLSGGTLIMGNSFGFSSGTGTFQWNTGNMKATTPVTINNNMTLNGNGGQGTFTGSNSGTLSGNITLSTANLWTIHSAMDSGAVLTLAGTVYLGNSAAGRSLVLDSQTGAIMVSGIVADFSGGTFTSGGGLTAGVTGSTGTVTLNGANTYTGLTTLAAGTLIVGNNNAMGGFGTTLGGFAWTAGTLAATGGAIALGNYTTFSAGTFGGSQNLTMNGTFAFSAANRILTVNNTSLTTLAGNVYLTIDNATGRTQTINGSGAITISGVIANNSSLSTTASGLTYSGTGTLTLSGPNTYSGVTRISSGVVSISSIANGGLASNIGSSSSAAANLVLGGGTLQYTGANAATDRNFTLIAATGSTIDVTSNTLTISGASTSTSGSLTKQGAGTLVLAGNNLYTGRTTVGSGTLRINNAGGIGNGAGGVIVNSGAYLGGTGTISGLVSILAGGHLAPGNSIGTLNQTGSLAISAGSIFDFEFGTTLNNNDKIIINGGIGTLTLTGTSTLNLYTEGGTTPWTPTTVGQYQLIQYSGSLGSGTLAINSGTVTSHNFSLATTGGWLVLNVSAAATSYEWRGNNNDQWDTAANWVGDTGPGAGPAAVNFGTLSSSGTVDLNGQSSSLTTITFRNSQATTIAGAGTLMLANSGIDAPVAVEGNTHTITSSVNMTLVDNAAITVAASSGLAIGGIISGSGKGISKDGAGMLTLIGNSDYTGPTSILAGTIAVGSANGLGTGTVSFSGAGTLQAAGVGLTLGNPALILSAAATVDTMDNYFTINNAVSGASGMTKAGNGVLNLGGANTYSGGTTLNAGILAIGSDSNLGTYTTGTTGTLTFNGGTLQFASGFTTINALRKLVLGSIGYIDTSVSAGTIAGTIAGGGALAVVGGNALTLTSVNTYTGGTTLLPGTLLIGNASTLTLGGGTITLNGGTLASNLNTARSLSGTLAFTGAVTFGQSIGNAGTGNLTLTGAGALSPASHTVTVNNTTTLTGVLAGSGSITKDGSNGTLILSGNNTYTGATIINAGTLQIGTGGTSGAVSSSSAITDNGVLVFQRSDTVMQGTHFTLASGGTGALVQAGTGTLTLNGVNTYSGGTTLSSGYLDIDTASALGAGTLTITGGTLDNTSGSAIVLADRTINIGGIAVFNGSNALNLGNGTVTVTGDTTLTVNGTNALTMLLQYGGYNFTKAGTGTLIFSGVSSAGGPSTLYLTAGQIDFNANIATRRYFHIGNGTTLDNASGGTVTALDSTNSGGGGRVYIDGSFTYLGTGGALNLSPGSTTADQIVLDVSPTITVNNNTLIFSKGVNEANGSQGFTKAGAGTLTLSSAGSYTGGTTMNGGVLNIGAATAMGATTGILTFTGPSTLNLTSYSPTIGALASSGSYGTITANSGSRSLTVNQTENTSFGGVIENGGATSVSLVKDGTGKLILNGANTYTGGTTVNGGTLLANNTTGSGTGTNVVTVASGGALGGTGAIAGAVYVADGGTLTPGMNGVGVLVLNNALTLAANATFAVTITTNTALANQCIVSNGAPISITGATLKVSLAPGYSPKDGDAFTLISNVSGGSGAVSGPFAVLDIETDTAPGDITAVKSTVTYPDGNVVLTYRYEAPGTIVIVK